MEQWIIQTAAAVTIYIVTGVIIYTRSTSTATEERKRLMEDLAALEENVQRHHDAAMPHLGCPAHNEKLINIEQGIREMKQQLANFEDRLYKLIKTNGVKIQ